MTTGAQFCRASSGWAVVVGCLNTTSRVACLGLLLLVGRVSAISLQLDMLCPLLPCSTAMTSLLREARSGWRPASRYTAGWDWTTWTAAADGASGAVAVRM